MDGVVMVIVPAPICLAVVTLVYVLWDPRR
jgi:hypothetical protein